MMNDDLTLQSLIPRCRHVFADRPIVSVMVAGKDEQGQPIPHTHRTTWGEVAARATRLAGALHGAGIRKGDRVASLAANSFYHVEAYLGVPAMGAVLHTLNIRLAPEQLLWIINHAEDRVLMLDPVFLPLLPAIRANCPTVEKVIVFGPPAAAPEGTQDYESFIAPFPDQFDWPVIEERDPAMLCYTSGTTGNPKGVMYQHRSSMLIAMALAHKSVFDLGENDTLLPIVPMFHAAAWGSIYTAAMYGAGLVTSGVFNDGKTIARLLQDEKVTMCAGVVTVVLGLLKELDEAAARGEPYDISRLRMIGCGGTLVPESLMRAFDERYGVRLMQAWGMTELSPLGTTAHAPAGVDPLSDEGYAHRSRHGRPAPFVSLRLMDDDGNDVPHDGQTMGRLLVRGTWVTGEYYRLGETSDFVTRDGKKWLDTGDIATIAPNGELTVHDRAKDLVKSGGEWISSADVEAELMAHPGVEAAVVVAVPHDKWMERPLALIIPRGDAPSPDELREHLRPRVAKWWIPDDFVVVKDLPIGPTGKFLKREIRQQYQGYTWSGDAPQREGGTA